MYFVPVDEGVCFVTGRGTEVFKGTSIYAWIERLAPHLDGRRTLDELTDGLPADKRAMVARTVSALLAKGLATDAAADRPDTLRPWERERYAAQIAYLEALGDSPAWRFERYRNSRFLVVGSGTVFAALTRSVLQSGVRHVTAAVTGESATDLARLAELVRLCPDERQHLAYAQWPGADGDLVAAADVVLHVSDRPMLARALRLARLCAGAGKPLVQATVAGDEAWIGPVGGEEWESAWRRLRDHGSTPGFVDQPDAPASPYLAGPPAALAANQVAIAAFRLVTGVEGAAPAMRRLDLATLETTNHRFHPHPLAAAPRPTGAAELLARVDDLRRGEPLAPETFDRTAASLLDSRLGIFAEVAEDALAQVPLPVTAVTVAGTPEPTTVTGAGLDFRTARWRAALAAVARYAHSCLDLRRTIAGPDGPLVWAYDLAGHAPRLVPATLAFAPGDARGIAARYDWSGAVAAGLLAQCEAVTVAEAVASGRPFPPVELDALTLDDEAAAYRRLLDVAGVPVVVRDITGSLNVPTFAFGVGPRTVAYAGDLRPDTAVCTGLRRVLLDYQGRVNAQPEYAPAAVAPLPRPRGDAPARPGGVPAGPADLDAVIAVLAAAGRTPLVVPLDHDPALTGVIPYVVNVVLADD